MDEEIDNNTVIVGDETLPEGMSSLTLPKKQTQPCCVMCGGSIMDLFVGIHDAWCKPMLELVDEVARLTQKVSDLETDVKNLDRVKADIEHWGWRL